MIQVTDPWHKASQTSTEDTVHTVEIYCSFSKKHHLKVALAFCSHNPSNWWTFACPSDETTFLIKHLQLSSLIRASVLWLLPSCISSSWHHSAGCWRRPGSPTWPSLAKWGHDSFASVFCASAGVSPYTHTHTHANILTTVFHVTFEILALQVAGYEIANTQVKQVLSVTFSVSINSCFLTCARLQWFAEIAQFPVVGAITLTYSPP